MIAPKEQSMAPQTTQSNGINPFFQLILIALSIPLIVFAFNRGLLNTRAEDPTPDLIFLTPEYLKELGGYPTTLKVGLYIDKFETFDIVKNDFIFTGFVWFQYNPGAISLETLSKFNFESGKILEQSEPEIRQVNGQLVVRYTIRVQCKSPLDYTKFPIDNHRIFIILDNKFISPSEFLFATAARSFVVDAHILGWSLVDRHVMSGFKKAEIDQYDSNLNITYPRAVFQINYAKSGFRSTLIIYLPLFALFLMIALGLSLPIKTSIKLTATAIVVTILYRLVIDYISPQPEYLTYADLIFFLFLGASLIIFTLSVLSMLITKITPEIKKLVLLLIFVVIDIVTLYLFWN